METNFLEYSASRKQGKENWCEKFYYVTLVRSFSFYQIFAGWCFHPSLLWKTDTLLWILDLLRGVKLGMDNCYKTNCEHGYWVPISTRCHISMVGVSLYPFLANLWGSQFNEI